MREHFLLFGRYNAWANRTLYQAVATLAPEEIARDRKGFFRSILGTLNHILVADRVWMGRMTGERTEWFNSLDQILFSDFAALRIGRDTSDRRLLDMLPGLPLNGSLRYANSKGIAMETPWTVVLGHVFNHQTHHRGQVHDMLSQAGLDPPRLDLLYFPRNEGGEP